ncbi:unnamed protein product [Heligmosomoides polygyrus]|uniref:3'-5' exonuclease domain-containing protein n=1 Tax=Heligmosomoides polygyrus TaxID=6339 RepID=A0A3P8C5E3_HELPZ|nr:unnamed protein product [Heligmosomoides polygyrus]
MEWAPARLVPSKAKTVQVPSLYLALFDYAPKYLAARGDALFEDMHDGALLFSLEELLMNVIIPYQLPHSVKAPCPQSGEASSSNKKSSKGVHYIQTHARVRLEIEQSIQLIRHFLPIKLSIETKVWRQIRYILVPSNNKEKLRQLLPEITAAYKNGTISYPDFRRHVQVLMRDLRGESRADATIPMGWACAALKKFAKKTYVEKAWKEENLYELIWTIMCQRPNLKKFICDLLEKDFHDYGAARYWRRMQPALMHRTTIRNRNELCRDPLLPTEEYLNFHDDVQNILFVKTAADLHLLVEELNRLKNKDPQSKLVVGLDAEWSAYVANSKATILQLSLRDRIFIIDLDNRSELPATALRQFFEMLFLDKSILKLGFQFNEDLVQMRAAVPHCRALFEPENVICVGKLFAELLERTEKLKNCGEILSEVLPPVVSTDEKEQPDQPENNDEEDPEIIVDAAAPQPKSPQGESILQRTVNRGLSYMCERVLGRPLDKTEQCSVWDRRPLRSSQVRSVV